jgi:uncharacterized protein
MRRTLACMTAREFDPFRLDVEVFAGESGELAGHWPLRMFRRIGESLAVAPTDADQVAWSARGERRALRGDQTQAWLHLQAEGQLALECQRCLKPVNVEIEFKRNFLFVHGEELAAQLDAETEDDVLAMPRVLDLRELIEDELLLDMPLVPRHEVCPEPLPVRVDEDLPDDVPNPFAVLAALKGLKPRN